MNLKRITPDEGLMLMTGVALVIVGFVGYVIWHVVRLVY
jgi:preprotein translocase subunit Sss1